MVPGRIPVKIEGRAERIAWLDPETAAQVVADGLGQYVGQPEKAAGPDEEPRRRGHPRKEVAAGAGDGTDQD